MIPETSLPPEDRSAGRNDGGGRRELAGVRFEYLPDLPDAERLAPEFFRGRERAG